MLNVSRKEIKLSAKNDLSGRWGTAIGAMLLATYIPSMVVSIPGSIFSFVYGMAMELGSYAMAGISYILMMVLMLVPTFLIVAPLLMGYIYFSLRIARHQDANATMPYRAFTKGVYGRVTFGYFMMTLFITLWSFLFIIPGIIKSFSYAMMPYIMMDNPNKTWKEALEESKQMMNGHKWDFFVLVMSFFGWLLLVGLTWGILVVYVGPYMQQAQANFYRALKGEPLYAAQQMNSYDRPQM
ncbi:MAG: DUF975 family protein [Firmicutes bacterium]|nr:DUF975 family protein [Bacillota bacterium]